MRRFKAPKVSKSRKKRRSNISLRKKNDFVSDKISLIMKEFKTNGMIGRSKPRNTKEAQKQAVAIAYSMAERENFAASEMELYNDSLAETVSGFKLMGSIIIATLFIDYVLKTDIFKGGLKRDN
tara:strand:+ start:609 stop:980 length:372 start_codon:yes stop_codon:yes gene_type:complete